jgi:hypothetical protein
LTALYEPPLVSGGKPIYRGAVSLTVAVAPRAKCPVVDEKGWGRGVWTGR